MFKGEQDHSCTRRTVLARVIQHILLLSSKASESWSGLKD